MSDGRENDRQNAYDAGFTTGRRAHARYSGDSIFPDLDRLAEERDNEAETWGAESGYWLDGFHAGWEKGAA
jgi:hypothetical protein